MFTIDRYIENLINLEKPYDNAQIIQLIENVVKNLNKLNEKCDYSLIETDQREELVPYILHAAELAGLNTEVDDITEQWREW